jgi:hypothetical protein
VACRSWQALIGREQPAGLCHVEAHTVVAHEEDEFGVAWPFAAKFDFSVGLGPGVLPCC